MTDRIWAMTRVAAGDYLLPSNDRSVLWRLERYEERDGTLTYGDGTSVHGDFWMVSRYLGDITAITTDDLDEPDRWECTCSMLHSRKAAIEEAMSYEPALAAAAGGTQNG